MSPAFDAIKSIESHACFEKVNLILHVYLWHGVLVRLAKNLLNGSGFSVGPGSKKIPDHPLLVVKDLLEGVSNTAASAR